MFRGVHCCERNGVDVDIAILRQGRSWERASKEGEAGEEIVFGLSAGTVDEVRVPVVGLE